MSFTFQTTKSVICEPGSAVRIGELAAALGCTRVAFVTDAGILERGLADSALASLEAQGIDAWVFSDVVADPPEAMILAAVEEARRERIDGVVSVGGGSSMDTAKLHRGADGFCSRRCRKSMASDLSRVAGCR